LDLLIERLTTVIQTEVETLMMFFHPRHATTMAEYLLAIRQLRMPTAEAEVPTLYKEGQQQYSVRTFCT
jgi:hypothetical protein